MFSVFKVMEELGVIDILIVVIVKGLECDVGCEVFYFFGEVLFKMFMKDLVFYYF